jgi:hypothetical protein
VFLTGRLLPEASRFVLDLICWLLVSLQILVSLASLLAVRFAEGDRSCDVPEQTVLAQVFDLRLVFALRALLSDIDRYRSLFDGNFCRLFRALARLHIYYLDVNVRSDSFAVALLVRLRTLLVLLSRIVQGDAGEFASVECRGRFRNVAGAVHDQKPATCI